VRVFQGFAGILDSWTLWVLIGYGSSSFWDAGQTSPKIFSFEHGQGEKRK
jgi:hypothetical protein